ncbi:MAG: hypothetical protein H0U70_02245 [Tatlockia sp.]|nr:hypothetical protein [Tatlockia sp.]
MTIVPTTIVLYVTNLAISNQFYQSLLGRKAEEASTTFHSFTFNNGISLGLKAKAKVSLPTKNDNLELAFKVENDDEVDELFVDWQKKAIAIVFPPANLPYGYTFLAQDPDGNGLRVVSLNQNPIKNREN